MATTESVWRASGMVYLFGLRSWRDAKYDLDIPRLLQTESRLRARSTRPRELGDVQVGVRRDITLRRDRSALASNQASQLNLLALREHADERTSGSKLDVGRAAFVGRRRTDPSVADRMDCPLDAVEQHRLSQHRCRATGSGKLRWGPPEYRRPSGTRRDRRAKCGDQEDRFVRLPASPAGDGIPSSTITRRPRNTGILMCPSRRE